MPPNLEDQLTGFPSSPLSDSVALDGWLDDGGSLPPIAVKPARHARSPKLAADTVVGCRDRAAADLLAAAGMSTMNGRLRMEASAKSWSARADLLQRMDDSFDARVKAQQSMR